jgi:hypothetical protein
MVNISITSNVLCIALHRQSNCNVIHYMVKKSNGNVMHYMVKKVMVM